MKFLFILLLGGSMLSHGDVSTATAEVRFGKNVRIGGHDVSNQTFNKKRRAKYYIYKNKPKNAGCRWKRNRDGSKTKICHLKRKKTR